MSTPILATKLYIPPLRPKVVLRPRLIERLNEGLHRKLTLISAPAGFGKTTLVSEWVTHFRFPILDFRLDSPEEKSIQNPKSKIQNQVAWLSLDESDNDPAQFLLYFVAALQTIAPQIGVGVVAALQSSQPPPPEVILTALLNEIATHAEHFVLVLDDYHVIEAELIDRALTFLLEHLPPQMHLVITTREDPHLPLARLRAQGQLTELRAADLRFTATEAVEFLNQVMGLSLSPADIAALEERTEGWIAGLQLAALSMQGRQDVAGFIRSFAGDNRYIVDYLVEEVLQRQPEPVRNFLLQTAIIDRLSGSLCDAVTGQEGGSARLETLERGNFFLVPLDDKRHWYRYHHLFADVIADHLRAEQPNQIATLHRRASVWYEQHGSLADAIRHALAGQDFERAAGLIELAAPATQRSRQEATLLGWLKALPEELFHDRPVLIVAYAGTIMSNGEVEGVEVHLRNAERWLDSTADGRTRPQAMVVTNEDEFRRLPGSIAMYRAAQSLTFGNLPDTVIHAQRVLDLAAEDDHFRRGAATAILGLASWTSGDLDAAYRSFADGMAHLQMAGNISDAVGGVLALADIRVTQGRLHDAMRIYERALQLARENGTPTLRGTADMYVGMSEIEREHNDLPAATQHLLRSQAQGEYTGFPQHPYRWRVVMARLRESQGDLDGALELLREADPLYVSDFFPNVRPVSALKARVWVAQGRLGEALGWMREQGLSVADDLSYLREFEHITLARVLLAKHQHDPSHRSLLEALGLLARLLQAAQAGGRTGSVIEILVLQALVHHAQGDFPAALVSLEQALTLAEPEGYVRIFVDEGPPMLQLLGEVATRQVMPNYTGKLLAAFEVSQQTSVSKSPLPIATVPISHAAQPLIEPLSQRELEILRLFKTELSGPEIARELVIALSTVRTHTKGIYSKLNVTSRRAAVNRAVELNLI